MLLFNMCKSKPISGDDPVLNEFKEFIAKGNVMDMAVGIIVGDAFTAIVTHTGCILLDLGGLRGEYEMMTSLPHSLP
jgi:hypothetical protein